MSTPQHEPEQRPAPRMSMGRVVELLLQRSGSQSSSVSLTRNAKGETQIEVVVRTGTNTDEAIETIEQAEAQAVAVYDRLRAAYPMSDGTVGGGQRA